MSTTKAQRRPKVKTAHFCENDRDLPIAGMPPPLACPWCGVVNCSIVFDQHSDGGFSVHVQCDECGVKGPFTGGGERPSSYEAALRAAELWNTRKGGGS